MKQQATRPGTLDQIALEAIAETAFQLATCQESQDRGGIRAALSILQAIATKGNCLTREAVREELAAYLIPFCSLQIGNGEGEGSEL